MFIKRVALLIALNVIGGMVWAADLPLKAPVVPAYDWTGFYLGGNLGASNGTSSISDTLTPTASTFSSSNPASFIGGGQLGINYEFHSGLVIGAEAMFDWLSNEPTNFTTLNDAPAQHLERSTIAGSPQRRARSALRGTASLPMARPAAHGSVGRAIHLRLARRRSAFPLAPVAWVGPPAPASNGLSQAIGPYEPNMIS